MTAIFETHPEVFDQTEDFVQRVQRLFRFQQAHYTREARESKALNGLTGPMVIIAPSGMAEAGRILHHLKIGAPDPRNTILIVGFQAEHTLGRRIVERRPMLKIHGEEVPLRARVEVLEGYSAHADRAELTDVAECGSRDIALPPRRFILSTASQARRTRSRRTCEAEVSRWRVPIHSRA